MRQALGLASALLLLGFGATPAFPKGITHPSLAKNKECSTKKATRNEYRKIPPRKADDPFLQSFINSNLAAVTLDVMLREWQKDRSRVQPTEVYLKYLSKNKQPVHPSIEAGLPRLGSFEEIENQIVTALSYPIPKNLVKTRYRVTKDGIELRSIELNPKMRPIVR